MNQLRIIAGKWRGRKIQFANEPGLRPTMDRIRETVFNWIQADVPGARCLDVFAGSGALGLEALSRGAKHVTFMDQSMRVINTIESALHTLGCDQYASYHAAIPDGFCYLSNTPFDVVFLDPPYQSGLIPVCLSTLCRQQRVHDRTLFYLELAKREVLELPAGFDVVKHKTTKRIQYLLVRQVVGG